MAENEEASSDRRLVIDKFIYRNELVEQNETTCSSHTAANYNRPLNTTRVILLPRSAMPTTVRKINSVPAKLKTVSLEDRLKSQVPKSSTLPTSNFTKSGTSSTTVLNGTDILRTFCWKPLAIKGQTLQQNMPPRKATEVDPKQYRFVRLPNPLKADNSGYATIVPKCNRNRTVLFNHRCQPNTVLKADVNDPKKSNTSTASNRVVKFNNCSNQQLSNGTHAMRFKRLVLPARVLGTTASLSPPPATDKSNRGTIPAYQQEVKHNRITGLQLHNQMPYHANGSLTSRLVRKSIKSPPTNDSSSKHELRNDKVITPNGKLEIASRAIASKYKWAAASANTECAIKLQEKSKQSRPAASGKKLVTKYKFVRQRLSSGGSDTNGSWLVKNKYKIVKQKAKGSSPLPPPRLVRKVGQYSIQYVNDNKNRFTSSSSARYGNKRRAFTPVLTNKYFSRRVPGSRNMTRISKHKLVRKATQIFIKHAQLNMSSKLVSIGGILYKSSNTKLSRSDNGPSSKKRRLTITKLEPKNSKFVTVRGVKFLMDPSGKSLRRIEPKQTTWRKETMSLNMSRVDLGGITYLQTKPGVLIRSQGAQNRLLASRVVNRSINHLVAKKRKVNQFCMFYNRFGRCHRHAAQKCPYIHDLDKVAICTRFLRGECTVTNCPFSHKPCPAKMPVCSFFLEGRCNSNNCQYSHVNVNPKADVCKDFVQGHCPLAEKCKKRHILACPEFHRTGNCDKGPKCPLQHVKRKARTRKLSLVMPNSRPVNGKNNEVTEGTSSKKRLPSFIKLESPSSEKSPESSPIRSVLEPLQLKPLFLANLANKT